MRTKVTLILILLNVALFFFIFKFERAWRTEDALREARRRVLGAETADIRMLTVTSSAPGGISYTLVRNRDVWMLSQPIDWPANQHAVRPILQALQFLENETSFSVADLAKNGQSLADYGLEKPRLVVAFTSGEGVTGNDAAAPTTVLRIGDSTNVGNRLYVLSPDGTRIHVVSRSLVDVLSVPLDQLRADTLLTIPVFEARALSVQSSGVRVRIARREGTRWMFDTIVNARASKAQMDLTINALNSLHAGSFPTTAPAVLPSASPTLRVTLDGNNRSETLLLGEPVKGGTTAPDATATKGETEYFGQLMNGNVVRPPVFTVAVTNELLSRLRNAQTDLRERRVLEASALSGVPDFDPTAVTAVTVAAPNQPVITLQRLEANAPESSWQLVRGGAAASGGPQTVTADNAAVHRLLDRLALLSATNFASDAPSSAQLESWGFNRPEREITIAFATAPGSSPRQIVLQMGTDTAGAVYARVGPPNEPGASIYSVGVDLAQDFPVDPKAWRDRTVRELPATARITALKLTDLSDKKTVYETTFDRNGQPATAPHDPTALQNLVSGLRTLRAKRFVLDHFTDRMMLAGDERTWRYQIDITVALPGAAAEQTSPSTLLFTERVGGAQEYAGSKEFDTVFEPETSVIDALWAMVYGARDPGPQVETK